MKPFPFIRFVFLGASYTLLVGYYVPEVVEYILQTSMGNVGAILFLLGLCVPIIEAYYYYEPRINPKDNPKDNKNE